MSKFHNLDGHSMLRHKPDQETASALRWRDLYGMGALSQRQRNLVREFEAQLRPNHHHKEARQNGQH